MSDREVLPEFASWSARTPPSVLSLSFSEQADNQVFLRICSFYRNFIKPSILGNRAGIGGGLFIFQWFGFDQSKVLKWS